MQNEINTLYMDKLGAWLTIIGLILLLICTSKLGKKIIPKKATISIPISIIINIIALGDIYAFANCISKIQDQQNVVINQAFTKHDITLDRYKIITYPLSTKKNVTIYSYNNEDYVVNNNNIKSIDNNTNNKKPTKIKITYYTFNQNLTAKQQKIVKHELNNKYQDLDNSGNETHKLLNKSNKSLPTLIKIYKIKHNSAIITN